MISADFLPIDLGLGFRLTGVGGVLGYQRTVAVDALRAGLKQGVLDNVLFPANPVRDAPRLVSALETLFPVREGQWVAGPAARITWGVPVLVTVELAIILEFDDPWRLVVLAQLRADLPRRGRRRRRPADGRHRRRRLRPQRGLRSTPSCSTRRFGRSPVTGDMARARPLGRGPRCSPWRSAACTRSSTRRPGSRSWTRVTVGLSQGGVTKLTLQAYLGDHRQHRAGRRPSRHPVRGRRVQRRSAASASTPCSQFSPFSFIVDLQAKVTVKWHGTTLLGVTLDLTLSGPSPWRARGKATLELWWFSTSVSFDRTIGDDTPPAELPAADPLPDLVAALADPRNWSARCARRRSSRCATRPPTATCCSTRSATSPSRQRVVPLGIDIDRFGSAAGRR